MLKTIGFLLLFFAGLALVTVFEQENQEDIKGEQEKEQLKIGYCKTFERYARSLAEENNLNLVELGSSFEVLSSLANDKIDYAVIGRRAYKHEINEQTLEIPLKEFGWTLVSSEKDFFEYSDIESLEIHTYLNEDEVSNFFPAKPKLHYHENIDEAFENGITLIHWEDFRDEFELVVPLESNNKIEKFRVPILYKDKNKEPLEKTGVELL